MTPSREDIIHMAREAASRFASWDDWDSDKQASGPNGNEPHEEREYWIAVVEFIAAAEREACAKVCTEVGATKAKSDDGFDVADHCAAAIRARGDT